MKQSLTQRERERERERERGGRERERERERLGRIDTLGGDLSTLM